MRALAAMIAVAVLMGPFSLAVLAQENAPRGWLGVSLADVSAEEAKALGFGKPKGAKIVQIADGSPASLAHFQPGDTVLAIDSEEVSNVNGLVARLSALRPGTRVILKLQRSGEIKQQEATRAARAEQLPDQRPVLRIDPGMHTAPIKRIGVDAACNLMVTGSDDKTARLWALPEGGRGTPELLRTLRVPIGEGNDGKVYAVALSPNGKWVAAGGWDATGSKNDNSASTSSMPSPAGLSSASAASAMSSTISPSRPMAAASPPRFAAAKACGCGRREAGGFLPRTRIMAARTAMARPSMAQTGSSPWPLTARSAATARTGISKRRPPRKAARSPYSIAVHPDGAKLAIGFNDSTAVEVYDARTLKRLYAADTSGIGDRQISAASPGPPTARGFMRAAQVQGRNRSCAVLIWQDEGRGERSEAPLSQNTIMQLLPCGDGIAVGAADPAFGLIAANGEKQVWQEGVTADMRGKLRDAFTLSADGKRVRFGLGFGGEEPVLFDLASFSLATLPIARRALLRPKPPALPSTIGKTRIGQPVPKLDGKPIALKDHEKSRSLAIAPDASRFVLGTEWWLRAYRADGSELWRKPVPSIAWGVNISGDGRLVVVAYDDGTIRWHRLSDGKELLALFVHAKDKRYIAWTPKGYYAASPGAEDLIGWHVNRDWDHAADFFPPRAFAINSTAPIS